MNRNSNPRNAAELIRSFRRIVTDLMMQPWGPESPFVDGIRIVARQLMRLEDQTNAPVDDALILELLPIVDGLERARQQAHRIDPEQARRFDRALDNLVRAMRDVGARPERPLGLPFDPTFHEAVGTQKMRSFPPDRVVEIMERGWFVGDRQVRPSKVVVSKTRQLA